MEETKGKKKIERRRCGERMEVHCIIIIVRK